MSDEVLLDEALVADPDQDEEMGPRDIVPIADEDLRGSRLLLVRRSVEPLDLEGTPGGVIELSCTFQPALGSRFTWAQLVLKLTSPDQAALIDIAPKNVKDGDAVRFTIDMKGKLGMKHAPLEASVESGQTAEFSVYHCLVQGSGAGTALARWDFRENPDTRMGLGQDQALTLTVPYTGPLRANVRLSTRVARAGMGGALEGVRDLILPPKDREYDLSLDIPTRERKSLLSRFLHI